MGSEHRVRRLLINARIIVEACKSNPLIKYPNYISANALPADAHAVGCTFDAQRAWVYIIVESDEFDPVAEGDVIPEHPTPIFGTVDDTNLRSVVNAMRDADLQRSANPV